ncbi:MAG: hypothetical protein M1818_007044 [Claussenomyces sp. TS43310]|nr:MAG: hypothetical protein M1818_007044 [Claussenomyces sp. TS43310]
MNISYPPIHIKDLPPAYEQLLHELPGALLYLLLPVELLYVSIYFKLKGHHSTYSLLSAFSLAAFSLATWFTPVSCGPVRSLQNFTGWFFNNHALLILTNLTMTVAIGAMKLLDIWARRHSLPTYTAGRRPADWLLSIILITELRYESFTPNHVRVPKNQENFNEPLQLGIHILVFVLLQSLPQIYPTVLALEVLLAIYIIWTTMQLILRYKTSPALFAPIYSADSLTGFWSETWHNGFASPCTSLAYQPLRSTLPRFGVPIPIARSFGVVGAFTLMATFHTYALAPIMSKTGLQRIGAFFIVNGIATVAEAMIWGRKKHWLKTLMAWAFEITLASWTAETARIPNGLSKINWREMCDAPHY